MAEHCTVAEEALGVVLRSLRHIVGVVGSIDGLAKVLLRHVDIDAPAGIRTAAVAALVGSRRRRCMVVVVKGTAGSRIAVVDWARFVSNGQDRPEVITHGAP